MELDQVRAQLEFSKRRRLAQTEQRTCPNTLSSFRFTSDELEKVADYFYDPEVCRGQEVIEEWELLVKAPKEPSQDVKEAIIAQEMEMRGEEVDPPPLWQRLMRQHRNLFAETVIVFGDAPDIGYYFLLGKQMKSNRESFIVYMATEIFGVKWRNWKLHFMEMDSALSDTKNVSFLRTYNLLTDPGETESRTVPDSWVSKAALVHLDKHLKSLKEHPPIPIGAPDPCTPPK